MNISRQTLLRQLKRLRKPGSPQQTALLVAIVSATYIFRAQPFIRNPQMFAEDGVLWLADGYNKSITALFEPVNGFLHIAERLFGYILAHLPLQFAPAAFCITAWLFFVLTTYYLLSSRTSILTKNYERLFVVFSLCLIANLEVFFFNFSNSVFLIGVIGLLIFIARPAKSKAVQIGEKILFLLACSTLPFAIVYLPVVLYEKFRHKTKAAFFFYTTLIASAVHLLYFLTSQVERSPVTLSSLFSKFTLLELYNQIIIPAVRFARIDIPVLEFSNHHYPVLLVSLVTIALVAATILVLRTTNRQTIYLLFFLGGMTFASFKSPTVSTELAIDAIKHMAIVTEAGRYFVYGIIAVGIILAKSSYAILAPKARYPILILFMSFGLISALHYESFYIKKQFIDYSPEYYRAVERLQSGRSNAEVIPVNPTPWTMALYK